MPQDLAELSRVLYAPVTVVTYFAAAFAWLYALTTTVGRRHERERGAKVRRIAAALTVFGLVAHVAHEITRGLAQDRLPLGNMFEVTSMMALVGVAAGVGYLTFGRQRTDLNGFVLLGGGLVLAFAGLMYAEPGPLMPILDTWWRPFHVSLLVAAMGIFAAAFVFHGLYLLVDTAKGDADGSQRGGRSPAGPAPDAPMSSDATSAAGGQRPVGHAGTPASVGTLSDRVEADVDREPAMAGQATAGVATGTPTSADDVEPTAEMVEEVRHQHRQMRQRISAIKLSVGVFVGTASVSWVFITAADTPAAGWGRFVTINVTMVLAALIARWFAPLMPAGSVLEGLAHRTIAFAFILWTVGTIAGAMWAEQSWGRFWGWDPKETGALLTWIAYAGYLHARATRGVKGRPAAWIGVASFVILMATYLIANYVIVGLHSYAGL